MKKNPDGSIPIFVGPKAPNGTESNWIKDQKMFGDKEVTHDNFASAEMYRYFQDFTDQCAVNNNEVTENRSFALRMYGLQYPLLNGTYKPEPPRLVENN